MAISDNYVPLRQLGNGSTTQFSSTWDMVNAAYAAVFLENAITGVQVPQTQGIDYSLVFTSAGFTVTFLIAAPTSANYVVVGREVTIDQTDPYTTSKGYQGATLEDSLDKLTAISQDLRDIANRSLKFQLGSSAIGTLPVPVDQLSLVWSGTSGALANGPSVGAISGAAAAAATAVAAAASATAAAASFNFRYCGIATGSANALILTPGTPMTSYIGALVSFSVAFANTAEVVTTNISTLGLKNIKKNTAGTKKNPSIGELQPGMMILAQYDGTDLLIIDAAPLTKGVDIASASTIDFTAAANTGNYANVTGTTTINSITIPIGRIVTIRHTGIQLLTNSGTLVLFGGTNITTAAGDISQWIYDGIATIMLDFSRANGLPLLIGPLPIYQNTVNYNLATASGPLELTGIPFTPSHVRFEGCVNGTGNAFWGRDDGITPGSIVVNGGTYSNDSSNSIDIIISGGNQVTGKVSSFAAGIVNLAMTKSGTPTGTLTLYFTAYQ